MFFVLIIFIIALLCYLYLIKPHTYWKRKGIPQSNPVYLFGDNWPNVIGNKSAAQLIQDMYTEAGNNRYFGNYRFLRPMLQIKDAELIKQIAVKDFDYFHDHSQFIPADVDPLWGNNLESMQGVLIAVGDTIQPDVLARQMQFLKKNIGSR